MCQFFLVNFDVKTRISYFLHKLLFRIRDLSKFSITFETKFLFPLETSCEFCKIIQKSFLVT